MNTRPDHLEIIARPDQTGSNGTGSNAAGSNAAGSNAIDSIGAEIIAHPSPQQRAPGWAVSGTSRSPSLRIISGSQLALATPAAGAGPADWQSAMTRLAQWLDLDLRQVPQRSTSGLRQMTAWAASTASSPASPIFAPWQCWSPVALQPSARTALPRASWVGSYLFDYGTGKPMQHGPVDVLLMSPLPQACLSDDDGTNGSLPRRDILQAMAQAARREGREKLAIVTDARQRNAMIRHLLLIDRSITRNGLTIEVVAIEDALCELVRNPARWDSILVMPDLRSLVFAMLTEVTGMKNPWPMLWHGRDLMMVSAETLDDSACDLPFNAPLLVQALALVAGDAGLGLVARRLVQGAARLWDCGVITPGRKSVAPYVTEISDADFIDQLCRGVAGGQRSLPRWRALAESVQATMPAKPAPLRIVASA